MRVKCEFAHRTGAIVPLLAICIVALLSFVALAIDLGLMIVARSQCQNAADIAALTATRTLDGKSPNNNLVNAIQSGKNAAIGNLLLNQPITDKQIAAIRPGVYRYSTTNQRFQADFDSPPSSDEAWGLMQVTITTDQPTFFGRVMGVSSVRVSAQATAVHRPRDIALVLDFSGSMTYGSVPNYDQGSGLRSLNPDPRFPRFGPWSIYNGTGMVMDYQNPGTTPSNFNNWVPPTPMQRIFPYFNNGGETFGPSNLTVDLPQGQAVVKNFLLKDNTTNAFVRSGSFPQLKNVFDSGTYPSAVITPIPDEYWNQQTTNFVGDKFPLRREVSLSEPTVPTPDQYAQTVADYLGIARSSVTNGTRDPIFEQHGYDWNFASSSLKPKRDRFQGFTLGPGYTGKTFYMWPPDPRTPSGHLGDANYVPGDWRVRFFLPRANSGQSTRDNSVFWNSAGRWKQQLPGNSSNYIVNYESVLAWMKRGPQTLPSSLRSGRVVYYDSIPNSIPINPQTGIISDSATSDQRFWKDYIDYVLGSGRWTDSFVLYGTNFSNSNPNGSSTLHYNNPSTTLLKSKITPQAFLTGSPIPYMRYDDNPIHPRMQFWFGPLSMLCYFQSVANWLPGTCYEAPSWQLKAGINAAMTDIKNNHPNDMASINYFSTSNEYEVTRVSMGKNFTKVQASLFYPHSLVDRLEDLDATIRPYSNVIPSSSNPSGIDTINEGNIPNGGTGTCPEMGLKVAFNQLSHATDSSGNVYAGRRGATKIVIFETDGIPNAICSGSLVSSSNGGPGTWYYQSIAPNKWKGNDARLRVPAKDNARAVVRQIVAPETAYPPGYSTPRLPARVHAIGFGEIFESNTPGTQRESALRFLTAVQIDGNSTPPPNGNWDNDSLDINLFTQTEPYKIIVGTSEERIGKLREAFERIVQGGVQIALIE